MKFDPEPAEFCTALLDLALDALGSLSQHMSLDIAVDELGDELDVVVVEAERRDHPAAQEWVHSADGAVLDLREVDFLGPRARLPRRDEHPVTQIVRPQRIGKALWVRQHLGNTIPRQKSYDLVRESTLLAPPATSHAIRHGRPIGRSAIALDTGALHLSHKLHAVDSEAVLDLLTCNSA